MLDYWGFVFAMAACGMPLGPSNIESKAISTWISTNSRVIAGRKREGRGMVILECVDIRHVFVQRRSTSQSQQANDPPSKLLNLPKQ